MQSISSTIISYFLIFSPIILILYCINCFLKREQRIFRILSYTVIAVLFSALTVIGIFIQSYKRILVTYPTLGENLTNIHVFSPYVINRFHLIGPSIWVPSLLALFILIPSVRRRLSTALPFSPTRSLHTMALSLSMLLVIFFLTNVTLGLDHLAVSQSEGEITFSVWLQSLFLAFTGLIGVGWISRISWRDALERLGITRIRRKTLLTGFWMGVFLSFFVIILETIAAQYGLIDPKITRSTDELIGPLFNSVFGILTLGLAAAIGEETIFRGALLPRFGIIYSSLLFAFMHIHYGLSFQLAIVFLLGIVLGLVRQRYNTTTSMVVHATYNMTLGVIGYLAMKFMT